MLRRQAAVLLAAALVALLHGILRGGWLEGLLAGVTLAMAILPEEFPVVLTVFLALLQRGVLPQVPAQGSLGSSGARGSSSSCTRKPAPSCTTPGTSRRARAIVPCWTILACSSSSFGSSCRKPRLPVRRPCSATGTWRTSFSR